MWTPTHVIVTVLRARNLIEKGKGSNDAYCMIGMGKEKFLTSVKAKTVSPQWDEQAEFELGEKEDLKITVYHKSSIIDEFIGRIAINVANLPFEHNRSFTDWYKLAGKTDKPDSKKKNEKERGEIEIRIEFVVRPKAGSMMDLSVKRKDSSLSLKNLKDKSFNLKYSLGDKLKNLNKSKSKTKNTDNENRLAEQSKRMGGSKLDFLDGEDVGSLTSSYSSLNGPTLNRQMNSFNRFNPGRASFISKVSSKKDNDSSLANDIIDDSINETDDLNEDEEYGATNNADTSTNGSFRRRYSSKFLERNPKLLEETATSPPIEPPTESHLEHDPFKNDETHSTTEHEHDDHTTTHNKNDIHIAPLPPFMDSPESARRVRETKTSTKKKSSVKSKKDKPNAPNPLELDPFGTPVKPSADPHQSLFDMAFTNVEPLESTKNSPSEEAKKVHDFNVDWNSLKETKSFEPTKVFNQSPQISPLPKLKANTFETDFFGVNNFKQESTTEQISKPNDQVAFTDLFSDNFTSLNPYKPDSVDDKPVKQSPVNTNKSINHQHQKLPQKSFPSEKIFSIDIDPFSSSSSSSLSSSVATSPVKTKSTSNNNTKTEFFDTNDFFKPNTLISSTQRIMSDNENNMEPVSKNIEADFTTQESIADNKNQDLTETNKFDTPETNEKKSNDFEMINENAETDVYAEELVSDDQIDNMKNLNDLITAVPSVSADDEINDFDSNRQTEQQDVDSDSSDSYAIQQTSISKLQSHQEVKNFQTLTIQDPFSQIDKNDEKRETDDNHYYNINEDDDHHHHNQKKADYNNSNNSRTNEDDEDDDEFDMDKAFSSFPKNDASKPQENTEDEKQKSDAINEANAMIDSYNNDNDSFRRGDMSKMMQFNDNLDLPDFDIDTDEKTEIQDTLETNQEAQSSENEKPFANRNGARNSTIESSSEIDSRTNGLPDLINENEKRKSDGTTNDKARKYLEDIDGVKFNEIQVPDSLRKQLEYFDREELLQLIAYQKKYLDYKESRAKDLENYIDNLVVKIIETEPLILMNSSNVLSSKNRNLI